MCSNWTVNLNTRQVDAVIYGRNARDAISNGIPFTGCMFNSNTFEKELNLQMVKVLHNLEYKADEVGTSGYPATIISFQMTDDTAVKLIDSIALHGASIGAPNIRSSNANLCISPLNTWGSAGTISIPTAFIPKFFNATTS